MGRIEVSTAPVWIQDVLYALRQNQMDASYVADRGAAVKAVANLLLPGDKVAVGGSVTLEETGILNMVRHGPYRFVDRYEEGLSEAGRKARLMEAFSADVFLCSANAITRSGEVYQVDGLSNRIAPLVYGPERVILVVGINKLVTDLDEAARRVRTVTAPAIVRRRRLSAPCAHTGRCVVKDSAALGGGCLCDDRRCCNFLVMGRQRIKGRVHVILVGESLGF